MGYSSSRHFQEPSHSSSSILTRKILYSSSSRLFKSSILPLKLPGNPPPRGFSPFFDPVPVLLSVSGLTVVASFFHSKNYSNLPFYTHLKELSVFLMDLPPPGGLLASLLFSHLLSILSPVFPCPPAPACPKFLCYFASVGVRRPAAAGVRSSFAFLLLRCGSAAQNIHLHIAPPTQPAVPFDPEGCPPFPLSVLPRSYFFILCSTDPPCDYHFCVSFLFLPAGCTFYRMSFFAQDPMSVLCGSKKRNAQIASHKKGSPGKIIPVTPLFYDCQFVFLPRERKKKRKSSSLSACAKF